MQGVLTIFRREFAAYFNSPIAYIFIIAFLLVATLFQMLGFFIMGQASMRNFFTPYVPFFLVLFIPAISMRLWAAEHRQGTFELLMTLPIRPHEVMLGKYLAALALYAITVLSSLPIVIMVNTLGNPDNGVILSGYLGLLLMGACFLAVGIFTSGLMRDQISAVILGIMACFLIFIVGVPGVAAAAVGALSSAQLREGRRWAVLIIVVFAAIITPSGDPLTLALLAVPMYVLYELAILAVRWILRK